MSSEQQQAPKVIGLSAESAKMFRFIATEEKATPEVSDNTRRSEKPFDELAKAFLLAAALGIIMNLRKSSKEGKEGVIRGEYIYSKAAYKPLCQLLKSKFDVKSDKEVVDLLVEFAEGGVQELYDEYRKTGDIDLLRISRLST